MTDRELDRILAMIMARTDMAAIVGRYAPVAERSGRLVARCPFHASAGMSLVVDPEMKLCFCLECDRQWGPVDLLMEMEHINYVEAVANLAAAAGVELPAGFRDKLLAMSDEALRQAGVNPSAMFRANRFAAGHFHRTLLSTGEGQSVGLAYLRERGVNDAMIERFMLGYAIEARTDFYDSARRASIDPATMAEVGLVVATERGDHYDRYHGRVIFPVFTVSGQPVAFGARTLRTSKDIAKYVNSPESAIYSKSNELYGLYQAREAMARCNRCILVEGYLDVISMHQAGIENVVAASGTSLTEGQVALIRRFTDTVTVIFDADAAGVKASLRSIDMLLAADMKIDIVSLPEGDDPDSFARSHTREEIEAYLEANAIDFIMFKLKLAADRIRKDPIERARLVGDIVNSIAALPDRGRMRTMISRTAFMLKINEKTLASQLQQRVAERLEQRSRRNSRQSLPLSGGLHPSVGGAPDDETDAAAVASVMRSKEEEILGYVVRNALVFFCDNYDPETEEKFPVTVIDYVASDMKCDELYFTNSDLARIFAAALAYVHEVDEEQLLSFEEEAQRARDDMERNKRAILLEKAADLRTIEREERLIAEQGEALRDAVYKRLCGCYAAHMLMISPDPEVRKGATRLLRPHTLLSRIHTRTTTVESEAERLGALIPQALCVWRAAVVKMQIDRITRRLGRATDMEEIRSLMEERIRLDRLKAELAPFIGDRVLA